MTDMTGSVMAGTSTVCNGLLVPYDILFQIDIKTKIGMNEMKTSGVNMM